jgi:hypothetical protein
MNVPGAGAGSVAYGALAREVNKRIRDIAWERWGSPDQPYDFFCVCGCFAVVKMTVGEYTVIDGEALVAGHTADQHERDGGSTSADGDARAEA